MGKKEGIFRLRGVDGVDFIEIGGVQFPASQKSLQDREDLCYCPRECRVSSFKLLQFKFGGV